MYRYVDLLPPVVKAALPDEKDQRRWMYEFNKAYVPGKAQEAILKAFKAFKDDPACRYFEGWLSVDGIDKQGDVMDQKNLFKALSKFVDRGGTLVDTHTNRVIGAMLGVDLKKFDDQYEGNFGCGVLFQGEPYYNHVWDEVKKGEKNSFSIGGFALDFHEECDGWSCHRVVDNESIHELSLCRVPAHAEANMTHFNQLAKADGQTPEVTNPNEFEIKAPGGEVLAKVEVPAKHLKEDGKMFDNIEQHCHAILAIVKELKSDDDAAEAGVEELEKVGTIEGACRHHRQHNHRMSAKCTGQALDVDDKEEQPKDDVRQPDDKPQRPLNYKPVAFVDEEKKKKEHARGDKYARKHSGVRRVNDAKAKELAEKVRGMMPAGLPDDARACYERAIRILSDNSGLPVEKRLSIISSGARSACEKRTAIKISARLRG